MSRELTDDELAILDGFLDRVKGGEIPTVEALDGFFAALACCPDMVMPSEYMTVIQSGETEDGDLVFEDLDEAQQFTNLVMLMWNNVNHQLHRGEIYLPLLRARGRSPGNDWAGGFLSGTHLRRHIWADLLNDEEVGGFLIPIMALAYEHDTDPEMRPFDGPIDDAKRESLLAGAAASVMGLYAHFLPQRHAFSSGTGTYTRQGPKIGRNEPCPCGSGKKYKKCCYTGPTVH